MRITVNGEERDFPDGTTASRMLELLKIQPERVVVEVNLTILKRAQHAGAVLKEGDKVEIVHFVGGGSGAPVLTAAGYMR
jgi:thiamine biosynthesis protein ThiS